YVRKNMAILQATNGVKDGITEMHPDMHISVQKTVVLNIIPCNHILQTFLLQQSSKLKFVQRVGM
ncbi:MAG: hypothetical protein IJZ20_02540, partial [Clostridia bacterium]|nr:hypothetical protein [Clostridia bacterium]